MLDMNDLIDAFNKTKAGSQWKSSTQKFEASMLREIYDLFKSLENGTYKQKDFVEFMQNERGKMRPIRSIHIRDRVVQRALCDKILIPVLRPKLIYDNGASLTGKGVDFTRRRLECHLHKYYREYGNKGWVLQIDFSKFFDNIPHRNVLERLSLYPELEPYMPLIEYILSTFRYDVSYGYDPNIPFDSSEHRRIVKNGGRQDGSEILEKSVGIGSQISQILGVWYPTPLDTWCKCVLGLKYYGRYMDDCYIFHPDYIFLMDVFLPGFYERANELDLFINPKKTIITPIDHEFIFLKQKYSLTNTGKVKMSHLKDGILRMRRRLKRLRNLFDNKMVNIEHIEVGYLSWRGNILKSEGHSLALKTTDKIYKSLFGEIK